MYNVNRTTITCVFAIHPGAISMHSVSRYVFRALSETSLRTPDIGRFFRELSGVVFDAIPNAVRLEDEDEDAYGLKKWLKILAPRDTMCDFPQELPTRCHARQLGS